MSAKIYILSGPVRCGKSTSLMNFVANTPNCFGFITPDYFSKKVFFDIYSKTYQPFEVSDTDADDQQNTLVSIGKFCFRQAVFDFGNQLAGHIPDATEWFIVDEIGPLEISQKLGFHELVKKILLLTRNHATNMNIVFVVRESLIEAFIGTYSIDHYKLVNPAYFNPPIYHNVKHFENTVGLILSGGKSKRMGIPKHTLIYKTKNQLSQLLEIAQSVFNTVCIGVNHSSQVDPIYTPYLVEDINANGPIAGILAAHQKYPSKNIMVMAIDYPLVNKDLVTYLLQFANAMQPVAFYNAFSGYIEPLLSFWPVASLIKLNQYSQLGHQSVKTFLTENKTLKIAPSDMSQLINVNTMEAYHQLLPYIQTKS
jgi:molybdopterin-guanine dinucleotide biosynthesis protein A/nucleoside-triphosphatase THEP1